MRLTKRRMMMTGMMGYRTWTTPQPQLRSACSGTYCRGYKHEGARSGGCLPTRRGTFGWLFTGTNGHIQGGHSSWSLQARRGTFKGHNQVGVYKHERAHSRGTFRWVSSGTRGHIQGAHSGGCLQACRGTFKGHIQVGVYKHAGAHSSGTFRWVSTSMKGHI